MLKFLSGANPIILEKADVFKPLVAFEVLNALSCEGKELFDLAIAGGPKGAVVPGILDQDLVSADGAHAVIEAVSPASRLAFDVIQGRGMNNRSRRPGIAVETRRAGDDLSTGGRICAETAKRFRARRSLGNVVTGDDPGTRNGILAKFHAVRRAPLSPARQQEL
jgi:hypothetical protein